MKGRHIQYRSVVRVDGTDLRGVPALSLGMPKTDDCATNVHAVVFFSSENLSLFLSISKDEWETARTLPLSNWIFPFFMNQSMREAPTEELQSSSWEQMDDWRQWSHPGLHPSWSSAIARKGPRLTITWVVFDRHGKNLTRKEWCHKHKSTT